MEWAPQIQALGKWSVTHSGSDRLLVPVLLLHVDNVLVLHGLVARSPWATV